MSKIKIVTEETGPIKTNCYLLYDEVKKEAALFDVGGEINQILSIIEREQLAVKYLFCTHLHFDHVLGLEDIRELFPEAKLVYNESEEEVLKSLGPFARMFGFKSKSIGKCDIFVKDEDTFNVGDIEIKAILSPGHTPGSMCFYFNEYLISGDVLFNRGIGRTDLPGGDYDTLFQSVMGLYELPNETKVYPGHGPTTYIGNEKLENPFISIDDI